MKRILSSTLLGLMGCMAFLPSLANDDCWKPAEWPVLKHYDSAHLKEVALPLGGIGTGTVALGGRFANALLFLKNKLLYLNLKLLN